MVTMQGLPQMPVAPRIRAAQAEDAAAILSLYRRVARLPGGLARLEDEISEAYVQGFLGRALSTGLSLLACDGTQRVVGEVHASTPEPRCFGHVLSDLTIAVDPAAQGQGVGRSLFTAFMRRVVDELPAITRVELIARESNTRAIGFYRSLGFEAEGELRGRIRNPDGRLESDLPMAWLRR